MFTSTEYDKLQQIMEESPQKKELLTNLLNSHKMEISMISHEIRNPLTMVYSTLQLIESQHPEITSYKHWNTLRQDIEYMKQLLEELSSYNNGASLDRSTIHTSTFFRTLALSFAASLIDCDIEFISDIPSDLPVITGDPLKLKQVFLNLLGNARDALLCCPDSDSPALRLCVGSGPKALLITVEDNGCGIAPEHLKDIFEPFITHKQGGTGLGLAIARRIILAHHGTLRATSDFGRGTTFTVTLPIQ